MIALKAEPKMRPQIIVRDPECTPLTRTIAEDGILTEIFKSTDFFYDFEIGVVEDMIASYKKDPNDTFRLKVAELDGKPVGVLIFDKDIMSRHSWNLYWIAVHKDAQNKGVGKVLVQYMEGYVRKKGGGRIYIETCSRELYAPTRRFYLDLGYTLEGRLKDYYATEDDKCIFSKGIK